MLFAGDTVEFGATPYCGDAHFTDWPSTIRKLRELGAEKMVPGRGRALLNAKEVDEALDGTERVHQPAVRHRARGRRQGRRPSRDLRGSDGEDAAGVRPLGHLRPLHAVQRLPRLRRGEAATTARASGQPNATSRCGARWKAKPKSGEIRVASAHRRLAEGRVGCGEGGRNASDLHLPALSRIALPAIGGARHPVVIAGGGMVGLTAALDLARHGIRSVLLDDDDTVSVGSRAICFAKRTLEIYGRLGLGRRALAKGVTWNTGRVFFGDREVYEFDLLPEAATNTRRS